MSASSKKKTSLTALNVLRANSKINVRRDMKIKKALKANIVSHGKIEVVKKNTPGHHVYPTQENRMPYGTVEIRPCEIKHEDFVARGTENEFKND